MKQTKYALFHARSGNGPLRFENLRVLIQNAIQKGDKILQAMSEYRSSKSLRTFDLKQVCDNFLNIIYDLDLIRKTLV